MHPKTGTVLILAMMVFVMVIPASAYDYQGVPVQSNNTAGTLTADAGTGTADLLGTLGSSTDIISLISFVIAMILKLLGITIP